MKKDFFYLTVLAYISLCAVCLKANAETLPPDKELFFKSDTLIKISLRYIQLQDHNKAEKALDAAFKIAKEIKDPYSRGIVLFELSDKFLLLDDTENAYQVAKAIEFSDVQSETLVKIAYKYAELEKFALATRVTKEIKDPFSKARAFYKIVNKLTDLELYDQAIKFAKEAEDSQAVIEEFVTVQFLANRLLKENHDLIVDQHLINLIYPNELYRKSKELTKVAAQYFNLYLFELAKKILVRAATIAQKIDSQSLREDVLQRIEEIRNKISKFEKSLNAVKYKNK